MKTISLYIHIPFCKRKCLYCDFLSFSASEDTKKAYVDALLREICSSSKQYTDYKVKTVFIGGGTPSILPRGAVAGIMECIHKHFDCGSCKETTIEINPGTEYDLDEYIKSGINRISIGLQSSIKKELAALGRIHDLADFESLYKQALLKGIKNINVDLMSGIPEQTLTSYEQTLLYLTDNPEFPVPNHISAYSLIVEEGTPFYTMDLSLPAEDEERCMYKITNDILSNRGYHRYEISNYALDGYESEHNKVYWERGNYLGLGLGSASMVNNVRWKNTENICDYIGKNDFEKKEVKILSVQEQMEEFMFLGLRMCRGISIRSFEEYFKCSMPENYLRVVEKYISMGLLKKENDCVMLTDEGINVSNVIMSEFIC